MSAVSHTAKVSQKCRKSVAPRPKRSVRTGSDRPQVWLVGWLSARYRWSQRCAPAPPVQHSMLLLKGTSWLQACGLISPRTSAVCQEVVRAHLPLLPKHSHLPLLPTLDDQF